MVRMVRMVRNHRFSRLATLTSLAVLVAIGVSVRCGTATATLIAYDPFNMSTGSFGGKESTSPGVWPTSPQPWGNATLVAQNHIYSGSLSVPSGVIGLSTNGNHANLANFTTNQVSIYRNFGQTYDTSSDSDLWFSFLYQPSENLGINQGISLVFEGAGPVFTNKVFFGSDGAGDLVIRAINGESSSSGADGFANTGVAATADQTFQIVTRIRGANDYSIWVNPTGFDHILGVPTGGTTATLASNLQTFQFNAISLGNQVNAPVSGSANFDEFRMGTTAVEVVPEPSTWALALGGVAAFFWRQSRRSRRSR